MQSLEAMLIPVYIDLELSQILMSRRTRAVP
jgi:hypothetical protein